MRDHEKWEPYTKFLDIAINCGDYEMFNRRELSQLGLFHKDHTLWTKGNKLLVKE